MEVSDIINYRDNTHVITDYRYDSFGRRIHTAERTKSGMRTIYDGLSFEVVKEAETFLGTRGITSSAIGEANLTNYNPHGSDHTRGTRYYFIRDEGQKLRTGKNGEALPDRTKGVRTYLYLNGERVAINNLYNTNHGQYYYGSDILGSVKFVTGQAGQELKRIEYDVFGGIYKGNSPYGLETGYTGKPYDAVTGLSDYGFRDYSPTHARFITEDPIRDGENWFAYCHADPINYSDPNGLAEIYGDDINGNPVIAPHRRDLKAVTSIEILRNSEVKDYNDTLNIKIGHQIIFQRPVQSEATIPEPKLTDRYKGRTLEEGSYKGTLLKSSYSYEKPVQLVEDFLIHPNKFTVEKKRQEVKAQGGNPGPWNTPCSAGCQVLRYDHFSAMTETLEGIGFKYNNKDTISVTIKSKKNH